MVRFPRDDQYRLATVYDYTGKGLLKSVNVSGANVDGRETTVPERDATVGHHTGYDYDRYPGSMRNPLRHREYFEYEPRVGLPSKYTDANDRVTRVSYDAFGREKTRITPDNVTIMMNYGTCPTAGKTCPRVSGLTRQLGTFASAEMGSITSAATADNVRVNHDVVDIEKTEGLALRREGVCGHDSQNN